MILTVEAEVTISAAHDGADTTGYHLYDGDTVVETKPVSALAAGRIAFQRSVLVGETHTYRIEAYRDPEVSDPKTVTIS